MSPAKRKIILLKFAESIRAHRDELALLESLDVGKPIRDTLAIDVPSAAKTIQWFAETIDKLYGEVGPTGPDALSLVTREPIGVVGAIVPWNYPLIVTAWKLGAALVDRQLGRAQARLGVPVERLEARGAGAGAGCRTASSTWCRARARCSARHSRDTRVSTRSRSPARPTWGSRCYGRSATPTSRPSRSSSVARARSWCWPTSGTSRRRRPHRLGDLLQQRPNLQRGVAAGRASIGAPGAGRAHRRDGPRSGSGRTARSGDTARVDRRQPLSTPSRIVGST